MKDSHAWQIPPAERAAARELTERWTLHTCPDAASASEPLSEGCP